MDEDGFGRDGAALEQELEALGGAARRLGAELGELDQAMLFSGREMALFSTGIARGLRQAFDGMIFDGLKLSEALKGIAGAMADSAYALALRPVTGAVAGAAAQALAGGLAGGVAGGVAQQLMPFAKGGVFSSGRVTAFARGGVVSQPVSFAMQGGTGLMGEAGPEAILPLSRGADGRLGVAAAGAARPVSVTVNVTSPDATGFRRSRGQIAAEMARALGRGERLR